MGTIQVNDVEILIPTRNRPELVETLLLAITHRPLTLIVDKGRNGVDLPAYLHGANVFESSCEGSPTKSLQEAINATTSSHILLMTDDINFSDENYNPNFIDEAVTALNESFDDGYGVVGLNDGFDKWNCACFSLFSRQFWLDNLDASVYGRYAIDVELTQKSKALNRFVFCDSARLPHMHDEVADIEQDGKDIGVMHNRMIEFHEARKSKEVKRIYIGLPIYGDVEPNFFSCVLNLMTKFGGNYKIRPYFGDSLIPRARNVLSNLFLKSDYTHLLFIDSDIIFSDDHIQRLISHDEDIVGGFYPKKKQGGAELVCNCLSRPETMDARRLVQMKYMGTGFLCIHRRVFEKMIEAYWDDIAYIVDSDKETVEYDFWATGPYTYEKDQPFAKETKEKLLAQGISDERAEKLLRTRYLSEDWYFCQRAIDLGFKVWGDAGVILKHAGRVVYPLTSQYSDLLLPKIFGQATSVAADSAAAESCPCPAAVTI